MDDEWIQWVKMGVLKLVSSDDKLTTRQQENIYNVQHYCSPNFQNPFSVAGQPNMVDTSLHEASLDFGCDDAHLMSNEAMTQLIQEFSTEVDESIDIHNEDTPNIPVCKFWSVSAIW